MRKNISIFLIITFLTISISMKSQYFENYGIKVGAGVSNQYWKLLRMDSEFTRWQKDKIGIIAQFYAEKYFGNYFSFKPELGYIQKGFVDRSKFLDENGLEIPLKSNHVVLHDLSMDLAVKIIPIHKKVNPYLLAGARGDYLLKYRDIVFEDDKYGKDSFIYDNFKKFTIGLIAGIGIEFGNKLSLEFEYNPSLTKNLSDHFIEIHDRYYSLSLGLNINHLIVSKRGL